MVFSQQVIHCFSQNALKIFSLEVVLVWLSLSLLRLLNQSIDLYFSKPGKFSDIISSNTLYVPFWFSSPFRISNIKSFFVIFAQVTEALFISPLPPSLFYLYCSDQVNFIDLCSSSPILYSVTSTLLLSIYSKFQNFYYCIFSHNLPLVRYDSFYFLITLSGFFSHLSQDNL